MANRFVTLAVMAGFLFGAVGAAAQQDGGPPSDQPVDLTKGDYRNPSQANVPQAHLPQTRLTQTNTPVTYAPLTRASLTYADLADLADPATLVIHAKVRKQAALKPERAPDLGPDKARLYIEADTLNLISGTAPVGGRLRYLVDVDRTARGRAPKLKKQEVILFARPVAGRPGEVQLVTPDAQLMWSAPIEAKLRPILSALAKPDAPAKIGKVQEALSVAGNLVGESETQFFVGTNSGGPVTISVIRRPGQAIVWGVSWSDIVDAAARAPAPNTLAWYRLACFLPRNLPPEVILSDEGGVAGRAVQDYQFIRQELGECPRRRVARAGVRP